MSKTIVNKDGDSIVVANSYTLKAGEKFTSKKGKETPTGIYEGTLRVVTEADILADPRLVGASVVAGQLYDFSNLPFVKDGATESYVEKVNEVKATEEIKPAAPEFSSEAERIALGVENPDSPYKGATK